MSRQHCIIDGYNLLHAHPEHSQLIGSDIDVARARLVSELAEYAEGGPRTIVVFDGAGNPDSDGTPHHVGGLTVVFSPTGQSADTVIEGLARRFRDRGEAVVVVTSDVATRNTVSSPQVRVLSSQRFAADLAHESAERSAGAADRAARVAVSRRIDTDVADALSRWVQGVAPARLPEP